MQPKYFESLYPQNARDKEIERIVDYIKEGGSSQIIGLPGVGRANILGLLAYNREVRLRHFPKHHGIVHFVMVNFSEVKRRQYTDVLKFIFLSLGNSLRERQMQEDYEKIDALFKDALIYSDELVFSQGLKTAVDYLAIEKKLTIVFLFDRFDEYIPQVTDDFFTLLRSLRDRAKYRFSVIFSLSRPLEAALEPQLYAGFSDFIAGHTIYLPLYDEPSITFRINYLEKLTGKTLDEKQRALLLKVTAGHMRLVKVSVEALFAAPEPQADLETFLLSQQTVQAALKSIWTSLSPEEQTGLRKGGDVEAESYLECVGLVEKGKIALPLFERALSEKLFIPSAAKLVYDETTNTIKKGEIIVSDTLTKAEFRLLRYLLQHPDEVIDRETIVTTVWQDDATTIGVTEQAVDQLIFRIRRKIGGSQ